MYEIVTMLQLGVLLYCKLAVLDKIKRRTIRKRVMIVSWFSMNLPPNDIFSAGKISNIRHNIVGFMVIRTSLPLLSFIRKQENEIWVIEHLPLLSSIRKQENEIWVIER